MKILDERAKQRKQTKKTKSQTNKQTNKGKKDQGQGKKLEWKGEILMILFCIKVRCSPIIIKRFFNF